MHQGLHKMKNLLTRECESVSSLSKYRQSNEKMSSSIKPDLDRFNQLVKQVILK